MRHRIFRHGESQDVFTDLLFNALLGFAFMFITAFAMINETSATGKVESKAEVLVTVRWADDHPDDGGVEDHREADGNDDADRDIAARFAYLLGNARHLRDADVRHEHHARLTP